MEPVLSSQWSCSQGAVGSDNVLDYLLSPEELRWYGFLSEGESYKPEDASIPRVFGLDCEMVLTTQGQRLARVSLVELVSEGDNGEILRWPLHRAPQLRFRAQVVYDALVKPAEKIINYLTLHSGITEAQLEGVTRTAQEAKAEVCSIVQKRDILCGHNLKSDLEALGLSHQRLLDTQILYPHQDGPPYKRSLEGLCQEHLSRKIQLGSHSSIEDASAALELVRKRVESRQGRLVFAPLPKAEVFLEAPSLALLLSRLQLKAEEVLCVYLRGSQAVGYAGHRRDGQPSDWDFLIVTRYRGALQEDVHLSYGALEAVLYDERTFLRLIRDCTIWALECIFAPRTCVLQEDIDFRAIFTSYWEKTPREVLHAKLRRSVSFEAGRKWSKAKRQLEQKEDLYSARKAVFIALRFLSYGIEVARTGRLSDLGRYNHLWARLQESPATHWPALQQAFAPLYKELTAALHKEAPKPPRYGGPRHRFQAPPAQVSSSKTPQLQTKEKTTTPLGPAPLETIRMLRALSDDPERALALLRETFRLQVQRHSRYPNVVQLRYTPQSVPKDHPIVRECRGLIVDLARGYEVLAYPFERFFNINESGAPVDFDWGSARVYEKLDGSLAILYWYDGAWQVASSRRPDASGLMGMRGEGGGVLFDVLFWEIWKKEKYQLPPEGERCCYLFELTSKRHPIIVRYPEERLTLIGARDLVSYREIDPAEVARENGWRSLPVLLRGASVQEVIEEARALDASLQEGFVACDALFRRVKIKSPDYLRMTWMFPLCPTKEKLSQRHLLRVVLCGEVSEFLVYCPEYGAEIEIVLKQYESLCAAIENASQRLEGVMDPAAFAQQATRYPFADVLFGMRKQRRSAHEVMQDLPLRRVERWLRPNSD